MSQVISPDLRKFSTTILSLIPYADNSRLEFLINKLLPEDSQHLVYSVKKEIKKLASETKRAIDLRSLFDTCQPVSHQSVIHYMDDISKEVFDSEIQKNKGVYTDYVYIKVMDKAQARANELAAEQVSEDAALYVDETTHQPLINANRLSLEDEEINSQCRAFYFPTLGMSESGKKEVGVKVKLDKINTEKARIESYTPLTDIENNKLFLWIYEHHSKIDFTFELELGFIVEEQQISQGGKYLYLLRLEPAITEKPMLVLFKHYLSEKKRAVIGPKERFVQPLCDSIVSKGYEQFYVNKTHDLAMLCAVDGESWQGNIAMKTSGNGPLWQFFSDANGELQLQRLLNNGVIQQALDTSTNIDGYAFVLKYLNNGNTEYAILWYSDYVASKTSRDVFNEYFKGNDFKFIKLLTTHVNIEQDAYAPSALPCHVHPKMAVLNRQTPKAALAVLEPCQQMLIVSDVTGLYNVLIEQAGDHVDAEDLSLPIRYQLPLSERDNSPEIIFVEDNDARSEDRFQAELDVQITRIDGKPVKLKGKTVNISTLGLKVQLVEEIEFNAAAEIELSITIALKGGDKKLTKQLYKLLGSVGKKNIRLEINALESRHLACRMIRKYIYQNYDELCGCGIRGSSIYGLQKAMRNIYAHKHFSVPFYLRANKLQQYISAASFSENSVLPNLVGEGQCPQKMLLNLLSNQKFRESCLSIVKTLGKSYLGKAFYIIVLPREEDENGFTFWYRDLDKLRASGLLHEFTRKAENLGKPAVLRVELKKVFSISDMYYRDELNYLRTIESDIAEELETEIESTIGVGEITDHTEIALDFIEATAH